LARALGTKGNEHPRGPKLVDVARANSGGDAMHNFDYVAIGVLIALAICAGVSYLRRK
jgi:hypothetical protein